MKLLFIFFCAILLFSSAPSFAQNIPTNSTLPKNPHEEYLLGLKYYNGDGVQKDYVEGAKWMRLAAEAGYVPAQSELGALYADGIGVKKDLKEAVSLYLKAAQQGDAASQGLLGYCYWKGEGVDQNYFEAYKWFEKSAFQDYAFGQYNLGNCYYQGLGTRQDYNKAVKWYRKAADRGNPYAMYRLGICYKNGQGTSRNLVIAYLVFNLAAARFPSNENKIALQQVEEIAKVISPTELEKAKILCSEWQTDSRF